jgi:hypothetical protein
MDLQVHCLPVLLLWIRCMCLMFRAMRFDGSSKFWCADCDRYVECGFQPSCSLRHVVPNVAVADASYMYAPQDSIDSPVNLVVLRGSTFNGTVTVEAGLDNAYQWRRNGENLSGQDEPALQLTCVTPANSGSYTTAITNAAAPLLTLHRRAINLTVNNFTVNAGPDQSICQDGIQLAASVPPIGSGTWSLVTGTGY